MIRYELILLILLLSAGLLPAQSQQEVIQPEIMINRPKPKKQFNPNLVVITDLYEMYHRHKHNLVFSNAPFKGLTFCPDGILGDHPLWSDASFGIGAFTFDFKEPDGREVSGLLFDHPVYIGWEFRLFGDFHLTTGTTLLERRQYFDRNKLYLFNSFVGMKARFNLCGNRWK